MTQDEIIALAREAGGEESTWDGFLTRFAALVAEATKEKAAKVCEEKIGEWGYGNDYSFAADECAAAIRGMK